VNSMLNKFTTTTLLIHKYRKLGTPVKRNQRLTKVGERSKL